MEKQEKENEKLCPETRKPCMGEKCAVWVKIHNPIILNDGTRRFADPEYYLAYAGCGKIQTVPWTRKKIEKQTMGVGS